MRRSVMVLLVAGTAVFGGRAYAHHSFAATYLEDQEMTIEGDLVQFLYRNPHSFVHVMAPDPKEKGGEMYRWAVEWGGGGQLGQQGVTRETLKPGDHVIITENMRKHTRGFGYARINADYPESYRGDPARIERFSDHDPAVAFFTMDDMTPARPQ